MQSSHTTVSRGRRLLLVTAGLCLTSLGTAEAAPAPGAPAIRLCADFGLFSDNTPLPDQFGLAGFAFKKATAGAPAWFVNVSGSGRGLQFFPAGGRVRLPGPTAEVDVVAGAFAGDFVLQARNGQGPVGASVPVHGGQYATYKLIGAGITEVTFTGGGNEGVISSVCSDYSLGASAKPH
jgi:hypothetical protein